MPDMNEGFTAEPLDLGTFELKINKRLLPGQIAPVFEVENLKGEKISLADYNGKTLLLAISPLSQPHYIEQLNLVFETCESLKDKPNFAMLIVSCSPVEVTHKFAEENSLISITAIADSAAIKIIRDEYGATVFPIILLLELAGESHRQKPGADRVRGGNSANLLGNRH